MSETYAIGIGKPFVECSNCGQVVVDRDTTEWELKNIFQKIFFLFISLYTVFLFAMLPVLIYGFSTDNPSDATVFVIYFVSVVCLSLLTGKGLFEEINASKERMKDQSYRETLQSMGLLK